MSVFTNSYKFLALNKFSAPVMKMTGSIKAFNRVMAKSTERLSRLSKSSDYAARRMANFRTAIAAVGAGSFVKNIIGGLGDFEYEMNKVGAFANATEQNLKDSRKQIELWGATTKFTATEVAKGVSNLVLMGNDLNKTMTLMPGGMALATIANIDLNVATEYTQKALNQFGMEANKSKYVIDLYAKAATSSAVDVLKLNAALNNTGTIASLAGMNMKETTVALMLMGKRSKGGARDGTHLMNAISRLAARTKGTAQVFKDLKIPMEKFLPGKGKIVDFIGLIKEFKKKGMDLTQAQMIGAKQGGKALALLVSSPMALIDEYLKKMANVTSASDKMIKKLYKGLPKLIWETQSAWDAFKKTLAISILPEVKIGLRGAISFIQYLIKEQPEALKWGMRIIGIVAAIAALGLVIGVVTGAFSAGMTVIVGVFKVLSLLGMISPFGALIIGIIAAIFIFKKLWSMLSPETRKKYIGGLITAFKYLKTSLRNMFLPLILLFKGLKKLWEWHKGMSKVPKGQEKAYEKIKEDVETGKISALQAVANRIAVGQKSKAVDVSMSGNIDVTASGGAKVNKKNINANTGYQDLEMAGT